MYFWLDIGYPFHRVRRRRRPLSVLCMSVRPVVRPVVVVRSLSVRPVVRRNITCKTHESVENGCGSRRCFLLTQQIPWCGIL